MIAVLIVSEVRLYREGLAQMLGTQYGMTVVGVRSDRRGATAGFLELAPDVVIVDMATAESEATVRDLKELEPAVTVVALGVAEVEGDVLACAEAGVGGYVTREASLDDLARVVQSSARGELQCSPGIAGSLLRRVAALTADRDPHTSETRLTIRECEVLRLIDEDLSNKEIANRLGIEVATVKNHVHNLLEKLNVHRRTDAARIFGRLVARTREIGIQPSKR